MYFKILSDISQLKGACTEFFRCRAVVVFCEMSVKILQDSMICVSLTKATKQMTIRHQLQAIADIFQNSTLSKSKFLIGTKYGSLHRYLV